MTGPAAPRHQHPARYCGRDFTPAELDVIAGLAAALPTRAEISRAVCDALGWHTPDGRRKDMTARVALNRMAADQLITLPPPRNGNGNGRHARHAEAAGQLALPLNRPPAATLAGLGPVTISVVTSRQASRQWNQLIRDHHYLGYTPLAGAQIRYLAATPAAGPIAALAFAASAWTCAPRDHHIGWDPATRRANLNLICGNARFLIRPDLAVPNLASRLLAAITRRLPADWHARYGYAPVLAETFVETGRFTGASYRAANWTYIGRTQGRGKLDRRHDRALPVKDIYLYPLHRRWRQILTMQPSK
ncbi:MAG: Druantia anti-phage system protein DruA [Streptosporangiaceae bacterium]